MCWLDCIRPTTYEYESIIVEKLHRKVLPGRGVPKKIPRENKMFRNVRTTNTDEKVYPRSKNGGEKSAWA